LVTAATAVQILNTVEKLSVDMENPGTYLTNNITYQITIYYLEIARNALTLLILWYFSVYKVIKDINI